MGAFSSSMVLLSFLAFVATSLTTETDFQSFIDVSLKIVKMYPELGVEGTILGILAEKPYAFSETKSNIISGSMNSGKYVFPYVIVK